MAICEKLPVDVLRGALACCLCMMAGAPAFARDAQDARDDQLIEHAFTLSGVRSYAFHSKIMGTDYEVSVGVPDDYEQNPRKKYPTLLVTDGNERFPLAFLIGQALTGETDQPIVVGIGSKAEQASPARRVYEFSPPGWRMTDPFGKVVAEVCGKSGADGKSCTGGAPKFLAFLTSELLPELSRIYRIDSNDLGLFGHSAAGFFASWAMFQETSPFKRYLIVSPAMGYGDGESFRQEELYSRTHRDLPVRVYLASGALEITDPFVEGLGWTVSGMARFSAALSGRKYPNLKLSSEVLSGLGHDDVVGTALARGFRVLYAK